MDKYKIDRDIMKNTWGAGTIVAADWADAQMFVPNHGHTGIDTGITTLSGSTTIGANAIVMKPRRHGKLTVAKMQKLMYELTASKIKKNKNKNMSSDSNKYYKVIKETPAWDVGAILREDKEDGYTAVNELFNREGVQGTYWEAKEIVEKQKDYFERVYQATENGKTVYVSKEKAKQLFTASVSVTA